jgi:hypothetical protein
LAIGNNAELFSFVGPKEFGDHFSRNYGAFPNVDINAELLHRKKRAVLDLGARIGEAMGVMDLDSVSYEERWKWARAINISEHEGRDLVILRSVKSAMRYIEAIIKNTDKFWLRFTSKIPQLANLANADISVLAKRNSDPRVQQGLEWTVTNDTRSRRIKTFACLYKAVVDLQLFHFDILQKPLDEFIETNVGTGTPPEGPDFEKCAFAFISYLNVIMLDGACFPNYRKIYIRNPRGPKSK